jgi:outer membrane protein assembly factor BamD (BamD/ComL family)
MNRHLRVVILITLFAGFAVAQNPPQDTHHGIMIRIAQIYINPSADSTKIGEIGLGREVAILDQSREWIQVLASVNQEKDITGWILNKGVVKIDTPDGDKLLFGEAAACELQASQRYARKGVGDDARRLYYRVFDYFPKSDLAGNALYRAADILWQLESADLASRPSARQRDPSDRIPITEDYMKLVIKKYPDTKWADMAAFRLIENKLCGTWAGPKCPDKEADIYEKYAFDRTSSPRAAEALYDAATRRAVLIEMYKNDHDQKKIEESRGRAKSDCQTIISKYPETDWAFRARALAYMVDNEIPTYGNEEQ